MFGAPKQFGTANPFGQQQQTPFGKPAAPAFGQPPTFGQQSTSLFGSTQPASNVFGSTATPAFGATATPAFGQTATTQSAFGTFGQPQQTTTSLFGQTTQANTLFGQPSTSGFGTPKPAFGGFNNTQPTSLFGQPATSTSTTGFGFNSASTSAFGQPQPMSGSGTAIAKYQPHSGTDTLVKNGQTNNVNTRQHCITAMKEYEAKSLEELRLEDYMANRKGPQAGGGLFSSTTPSTGIFGAPASQPQSTGLFGQPSTTNTLGGFGTQNAFGQSAPAFGQTPGATNSLFGKPTSTFGQPAAPFGQTQPTSGGLFGNTPATSTSTGFGFNSTANANPFGTKPAFGQASTGLFGQPTATSTGSTFGQPNAFGGFGATAPAATSQPAPLFGSTTNTGNSLFGGLTSSAPNTSFGGFGTATNTSAGGLFGQKPATGFGATPGFGTSAASTGTGFGLGTFNTSTSSGFGGFGQSTFNKPASTGFTGFGTQSNAPTLGGGIGLGTNLTGFGITGVTTQQPQQTAVPIHQQILSMTTSPYGDNPIFKDLKPLSNLNEDALKPTNPAAQKAILESSSSQYKISPKITNGMKLKPVGSQLSKKSLFGGLEEFDSSVEESFSLKPNAKRLIIKPKVSTGGDLVQNNTNSTYTVPNASNSNAVGSPALNAGSESIAAQSIEEAEPENSRRVSWLHSNLEKMTHQNRATDATLNNTIHDLVSNGKSRSSSDKLLSAHNIARQEDTSPRSTSGLSHYAPKVTNYNNFTANDSILSTKSFLEETTTELPPISTDPHPTGIVLTRPGYYTIPPLDKLTEYLTDDGRCIVPNFTVGRKGYGNVYFGEPIDVAGLNLDELVYFRHKEVIIYPDDENKPPVGTELNRKAQITLDQVWPHDKTLHEPIKDRERLDAMDYEGKLRSVCDKHDTRFVEYRPETGSWVFKVDHFSKYGLNDSDEEDDVPSDPKKFKANQVAKTDKVGMTSGVIPKTQLNINKIVDLKKSRDSVQPVTGRHRVPVVEFFNSDEPCEYGNDFESVPREFFPVSSPSAELAADMGTDSHKLQLMKASFFVDDDYDAKSVISDQFTGRESPDQIVPNKRQIIYSTSTHSVLSKEVSSTTSSSTADTPILSPSLPTIREYESKKLELIPEARKLMTVSTLKSTPLIIKPKMAIIKACESILPLSKSLLSLTLKDASASDCAFFNGRRFKIGWNHANTMTILNTVNQTKNAKEVSDIGQALTLLNGRDLNDTSVTVVQHLKLSTLYAIEPKTFLTSIENHLKCQLKFAKRESVENSDCPAYMPNGGTLALQEHFELAQRNSRIGNYEELCESVWSLCVALWGDQEELEDVKADDHIAIMLRRELFSNWLENVAAEKDLLDQQVTASSYLDHLWKLMTSHKVNEACDLAFSYNDVNLSLLLAQAGSSKVVRALISQQLESWRVTEADKFIAVDRLKSMMLVAALATYESSEGLINIYEKLDWLKSLAINVWYLCSPTASITDALIRYEQATVVTAVPPTPPYRSEYDIETAEQIQDIRYHILKLYSVRSHPLEKLLNPATHTVDLMDFRLSWLLLQALKGIGYQHCSEQSEAQLHVSFASQLENYGLWHWSIFVLLHIQNKSQRELSIQQILYRYIELSSDDEYQHRESFIVNALKIPEKWIYWAKAVRAGAFKRYRAQADFLLKARQWSLAHEVIMNHIAPDAIINEETRYLRDLLDRFEEPQRVPSWSNQGKILRDYLDITAKFELLKTIHERDIETRWEGLKPELSELCSRINMFPCPTAKHRLCQSEIAQGLAILVNGMEILYPELNPCLLVKNALEKLPLPEEYAKQKIRNLLDNSNLIEMLQTEE